MVEIRIISVSVPDSYIEDIKKLVKEKDLYPSRSELIRCAVRKFLIKEMKNVVELMRYEKEVKKLDEKEFVRIPIESDEPIQEYKTYKILKRLEY